MYSSPFFEGGNVMIHVLIVNIFKECYQKSGLKNKNLKFLKVKILIFFQVIF